MKNIKDIDRPQFMKKANHIQDQIGDTSMKPVEKVKILQKLIQSVIKRFR